MTFYQIYRATTLGIALQASIDELVNSGELPETLTRVILSKFDACMQSAFKKRVKNEVQFTAHLDNFRFCDDVWTLLMKNVEFRGRGISMNVDKVKFVAVKGNPTPVVVFAEKQDKGSSGKKKGKGKAKGKGKSKAKPKPKMRQRKSKRKYCVSSTDESSEEPSTSSSVGKRTHDDDDDDEDDEY